MAWGSLSQGVVAVVAAASIAGQCQAFITGGAVVGARAPLAGGSGSAAASAAPLQMSSPHHRCSSPQQRILGVGRGLFYSPQKPRRRAGRVVLRAEGEPEGIADAMGAGGRKGMSVEEEVEMMRREIQANYEENETEIEKVTDIAIEKAAKAKALADQMGFGEGKNNPFRDFELFDQEDPRYPVSWPTLARSLQLVFLCILGQAVFGLMTLLSDFVMQDAIYRADAWGQWVLEQLGQVVQVID